MQLSRPVFVFLLIALCIHTTAAGIVQARQDGADSSSTSVQRSAAPTSAASAAEPASTTQNDASSTAAPSAVASSAPASVESSAPASVSSASTITAPQSTRTGAASPTSTAPVYSGHGLPLEPKVTPAVGIIGAVLMISGAVYTLIGIKNQWIQIGGSVAFLVALSITVLIEYVMNPPVTDAVQGAFFVAAFIPAMLAGGVAYIFKDITEGLGCLLGGFCISMWFLVLKAGGLIGSTSGRAIFIGVFCAVCWALSFSHYTRTYGLIGCTSFAGATITVLGIDCFSRAGLKEFWLYLWDLNNDTFPLYTNTYPITRGIRVEIACIIIITLLGIASQMKLWKVVKARREEREASRRQKEEDQERLDEEIGRKVMEDTDRERRQWEAVYGDKPISTDQGAEQSVDSGIGSTPHSVRKTSVSVKEVARANSEDSIEMDGFERSREEDQAFFVGGHDSQTQDDAIQHIDAHGRPVQPPGYFDPRGPMKRQDSMQNSSHVYEDRSIPASPRVSMAPPGPPTMPLPFVVPTGDDSVSDVLEQESVASIPGGLHGKVDATHRLSDFSNSKRGSSVRNSQATSQEALIAPNYVEDDRASSIAATLDEMNEEFGSLPALSRVGTPFSRLEAAEGDQDNEETPSTGTDKSMAETTDAPVVNNAEARTPDVQREFSAYPKRFSLASSTDQKADGTGTQRATRESRHGSRTPASRDEERSSSDNQARSRKSTTTSEIAHSTVGSLTDHLPDKLSKIMLTYRTNEWAKHASMAEQPELESIPEPSSPGIMVDLGFKQAAETLQKSPVPPPHTEVKPENNSRDDGQFSQTNPYRQSLLQRSSSSQSKNASASELQTMVSRTSSSATLNVQPGSSQINLQRNSSSSSVASITRPGSALAVNSARGLRASSSPVNAPIVEQPSEETVEERPKQHRFVTSPLPTTNTLLNERDSRMRNKPTKMSFIAPPGQSPVIQPQAFKGEAATPSDSMSVRSAQLDEVDPDNMSLSQRRTMIQQQKRQSSQRQASYPPLAAQNFDSHQPKRGQAVEQGKREAMFASWRGSLQQDQQLKQPQRENEDRRSAMINDRRQKQLRQQQQEINRQNIDMMIHEKMRTGQMQDLHRERLRRLQAGAKTE